MRNYLQVWSVMQNSSQLPDHNYADIQNSIQEPQYAVQQLPKHIPTGIRVVVRRSAGIDEKSGRTILRDAVGHVINWDGSTLTLLRDESANGARPAQIITIEGKSIVRIKPVPERPKHYPTARS